MQNIFLPGTPALYHIFIRSMLLSISENIWHQCCEDAHILDVGSQHLLFGPTLLLRTCLTPLSCRLFTRKLTYPLRRMPCSLQINVMSSLPLLHSSGRHNCTQFYVIQRSDLPVPTDIWVMYIFQHFKINIPQTHIIDRNQSTAMHHAQIKCDNLFLWLGLFQKFPCRPGELILQYSFGTM